MYLFTFHYGINYVELDYAGLKILLISTISESYLAKFTIAHGIPVGELNAGRSLSPSSLAFTLKT